MTISEIEQKIAAAERGLRDLGERRERLAADAEHAAERGAASDFASYLATGELAATSRAAAQVAAELADVDALVAAGEARIAGLQQQAKQLARAEQAARVAAMTMSDAVAFARDALNAVDLDGARAEIDRIEQQIDALDAPRLTARDEYAAANFAEQDLLRRYRGSPDRGTGLTPEAARAKTAEALGAMNRLRDRSRSLQGLHEQARDELTVTVAQALAHVGRLAGQKGAELEKHAAAVVAFSRAMGGARPALRDIPPMPTVDLPPAADVAELKALAEPILALSRRAAPPSRPESAYAPPALQ